MYIRLSKEHKVNIGKAQDVYKVMQPVLMRQNKLHRMKEYFFVMGLNNAGDILYVELVAVGILNQVCLDPVEVFCYAIARKCKRLILVHNHPSGILSPSHGDKEITKRLLKGGKYLCIDVLDHIIITEEGYVSLNELGLMK